MVVRFFLEGLALYSLAFTVVVIVQMYSLSVIIHKVFMLRQYPDTWLLILLAGTILLRSALIWARERFAHLKAVEIKSNLRRDLFKRLMSAGPAYTGKGKTGSIVASVMEGTEKLDDYFTKYIPSLVHIAVLPLVIIGFTLSYDWMSGLILLVTGPLILFFMFLIGTYASKISQKQWKELSNMSSHFLDALQGLKTLKILGKNKQEQQQVWEQSNRFREITMTVLRVAFLSGMVLELAASISIALVAVQIGIRLIEGLMIFQSGLFILLMAPEFYLPFRTLGSNHHAGMEGAAAAEKIFELMDEAPTAMNGSSNQITVEKPLIRAENITFRYAEHQQPVLSEVWCCLKPKTLTALVGPSGAGKTTFIYLLMGFLRPESGKIRVNEVLLDDLGAEAWLQNVAYVPQHPHFFDMTVKENLMLAKPSATPEQLDSALKQARADVFIRRLPEGCDTALSENASRLSGGEKQRLALARAFLKDAPLLILDEPTSNLDPESEQYISEAAAQLMANRTTIIIAHRLKTVKQANQILVFDKGRIAETGSHQQLKKQDGIYARFLQDLEPPNTKGS